MSGTDTKKMSGTDTKENSDNISDRLEEGRECTVCYDHDRNVVLTSCKHFLMCSTCCYRLLGYGPRRRRLSRSLGGPRCPICRVDFDEDDCRVTAGCVCEHDPTTVFTPCGHLICTKCCSKLFNKSERYCPGCGEELDEDDCKDFYTP